jgi:hypothetical protein
MSTLEWRVGCVARGVYAIGCADAVCALANPELAIDAHLPQRSRSHASQIGRSHLILLFVCFKRGLGIRELTRLSRGLIVSNACGHFVISQLLRYHCRWLVTLPTPIGMYERLIRAIVALATPWTSKRPALQDMSGEIRGSM